MLLLLQQLTQNSNSPHLKSTLRQKVEQAKDKDEKWDTSVHTRPKGINKQYSDNQKGAKGSFLSVSEYRFLGIIALHFSRLFIHAPQPQELTLQLNMLGIMLHCLGASAPVMASN